MKLVRMKSNQAGTWWGRWGGLPRILDSFFHNLWLNNVCCSGIGSADGFICEARAVNLAGGGDEWILY